MNKFIKAFIACVISIGYVILYQLIGKFIGLFISFLFNIGFITEPDLDIFISSNINAIQFFKVFLFILVIYSISFLKKKSLLEKIDIKKINIKDIFVAFHIFLALNFIMNVFLSLNIFSNLREAHESTVVVNSLLNGESFWLILLSVGILGPIAEEILFRGLILNKLLTSMNIKKAILIQAILFGIAHEDSFQMIYAFIFALFYGIVSYSFKSIVPAIIMHMYSNSITIINLFVNNPKFNLFVFFIYIIAIALTIDYIIDVIRKKKIFIFNL